MIYMEPTACAPTKDRIQSWTERLHSLYEPYADQMRKKAECLDELVLFLRINCSEYMVTVDNNLIDSFFRVYDGFMGLFTCQYTGGAV